MNYWLHRNNGGENAFPYTQPLLDKGFISIGWKGISNDNNKSEIQQKGWSAVDEILTNIGWRLGRNRYCLSRFINDMKKGDIVVVPCPGHFSIYEIEDDNIYSNESFDVSLFTDVNGILASRHEHEGYFTFVNNQGNEIDLGFYRRVKARAVNLSRYNGIEPALYAKMRTIMTNICISDVGSAIDKLLNNERPTESLKIVPFTYNVDALFQLNLSIPIYQRPYVWTKENIEQLLSDIKKGMEQGKRNYRLGSIIINDNQIVDGQQRITTLALLRKALGEENGVSRMDTCNLTFNHVSSFTHIRENYKFIKGWVSQLQNAFSFEEYLNNNCECILLSIKGKDGLAMAFKLFDSQNGRGKPLEAYNLLKAYHLRAMQNNPSNEKIQCDRTWEQATRFCPTPNTLRTYDILKHLFDEQLYRGRIWSRNRSAWSFNKKHIAEFKGMCINQFHSPEYPFQNKQLLLYMTEKFYQSFLLGTMPTRTRFSDNDDMNINPFTTISQPIVDGKNFFEYITTYSELYKRIFIELDSYQLREFKQFYSSYCLGYTGHWRTGDNYVREMYKTIILYVFDKFGEDTLNKYYKILYLLSYIVRRENGKVFYQTVAKHPQEFFSIIHYAKSEFDLEVLKDKIKWKVEGGFSNFTQYEEVIEMVNKHTK